MANELTRREVGRIVEDALEAAFDEIVYRAGHGRSDEELLALFRDGVDTADILDLFREWLEAGE